MRVKLKRSEKSNSSIKKLSVILICIIFILGLSISPIVAKLIAIDKDDNFDELPYLKAVKDRIDSLGIELTLHKDQSITTIVKVRKKVITEGLENQTGVLQLGLDNTKNYDNIQVYNSLNEAGIAFEEASSLVEPPKCNYKFTFNTKNKQLRFCIPISPESEIKYTIKYISMDINPKIELNPEDLFASASFELPNGEYDANIKLMGDERVISKQIGNCPFENMSLSRLENGIFCSGHIKVDSLSGEVHVLEANLKGIDKEALEKQKSHNERIWEETIAGVVLLVIASLSRRGRKFIQDIYHKIKDWNKPKPNYCG